MIHVSSVLRKQSDQILQERLGIGISQFRILSTLHHKPDVSQRHLADYLGQTEASVSRQIKLLQQKGFLVSQVDPQERRRHITTMTTRGAKVIIAAQEVLKEMNEQMINVLGTRDCERFGAMLARLHEHTCAPGNRIACQPEGADGSTGE